MSEFDGPSSQRLMAIRASQQCYESLVAKEVALCRPASDDELSDPLGTLDPIGWLGGSVKGKSLLCLAAGGGRQSALYATAGADVTVVDISPAMLELDRQVARRCGLHFRLIQGSMDRLDMLATGSFDVVVQPVSTCYLPDVAPVFAEVARVLRPGGLYVSQHKSPTNLQASHRRDSASHYWIQYAYYRTTAIPPVSQPSVASGRLREQGAVEYLHRLEQLIGGICRAGMVIEDFIEPLHVEADAAVDSFADRAQFIAPYLRIKARRIGAESASMAPRSGCGRIVLPD